MRIQRGWLIAAGAALALAAAWTIVSGEPLPAVAHAGCDGATITDPSQPIEATVGSLIALQQPANATTGYGWLMSGPPDPTIAQLASSTYLVPAQTNPPVVGRGGVQCWEFLAVGEGTTSATFDYRRPFALSDPNYQSVTFTLVVDPAS